MKFHELEQDKIYKVKGEAIYYMLGDNILKFKPNPQLKWLNSGASYNLLISKEHELVKEPVDFMTAINSGKKIYPVEYFGEDIKETLEVWYESEADFDLDGLWKWLEKDICNGVQRKYINGMWYTND